MYAFVLALAVIIPFPLCLFRMKKYNISLPKMLIIYLAVSTVGATGSFVGSALAGGSLFGMRLYGLMFFDFLGMFLLSLLLKIDMGRLGDFVAPPLMAVCFSAKIACLVSGCCYGFVMFHSGGKPIRFPSVLFEMMLWATFTVLLLILEKSRKAKNIMWPLALVWFGFSRSVADLMRGVPNEKEPFLLGLPGGLFWSIIVLVCGLVFMYCTLYIRLNRRPQVKEYMRSLIGLSPVSE